MVPSRSASSDKYHHFSGCVSVAASTPCRTCGNKAVSTDELRILRILLRILRKVSIAERGTDGHRLALSNLKWQFRFLIPRTNIEHEPNRLESCSISYEGVRRLGLALRDQQGLEVDFLVPRPDAKLWLIEAKSAKTVRPPMASPLNSLQLALQKRAGRLIVVHRKSRLQVPTPAIVAELRRWI